QLEVDLQFKGVPMFFSWPSAGNTWGYPRDEVLVERRQPHLTAFVKDVLRNADVQNVYLIAHSMGNRALTRALLDVQTTNPQLVAKVREVIMAAPDIDAATFKDDIAPRMIAAMAGTTTHATLYASSRD